LAAARRFLIVSHVTEYNLSLLLINIPVLALVLIPKLPLFDAMRSSPTTEGKMHPN